jgi:serine/threonine protein kinase
MPLSTGDRLGAYEVIALLGHGAMGEVYRARDTHLGRDVAIKVLPAAFANDPDRRARLEREARLISQVNHPNICTLFHVVEECLVLELVEGETLQQRLLRGPLPLREALRHSAGIAAALEAAHSRGIIHRDLKPANIKITSAGTIKVLDFGVAKLAEDAEAGIAPDITAALGGTKEGVLVGTVAYMSPEQAMGDRVDRRSDIWAFGCVLFEMLTARRAFHGTAVADTLGAVMRGEPDWSALPAGTPPEIHKLLQRCLEKDRARRLADIAHARLEVEELLTGRSEPAPKVADLKNTIAARSGPRRGRWIAALAFLAGVIFATMMARLAFDRQGEAEPPAVQTSPPVSAPAAESHGSMPDTPPPPSSSVDTAAGTTAADAERDRPPDSAPAVPSERVPAFIGLPDGVRWARPVDGGGVPNTILAISPDGRLVVFSGRTGDVTALWLRSFTFDDVWQLPGTEGGVSPFWSPDGASIGFFADRKLKRLDLNGLGTRSRDSRRLAMPVTLSEVGSQRGGTWAPDDTIVFAKFPGELKRISAKGGAVNSLTDLDRGEPHHVRPHFFAGTMRLLYRVTSDNGRNNAYYVTAVDSREKKLIATLDAGNVTYAQGHLLFMQNHTLMAQPFDVKNAATTGPPRPIASGVLLSTGSPPVFGVFSASQTGRLVYLSQGGDVNDPMTVLSNWAAVSKQ